MSFEAGELLVTCPIRVDQAELVVVATRAGEDDPPDVLLCRRWRTRDGCHRCRQRLINKIQVGKVEGSGRDQQAQRNRNCDQDQPKWQMHTPWIRATREYTPS